MGFVYEERLSDSLYIENITYGHTVGEGSTIRPAEIHWHMVLVKHRGGVQFLLVGPLPRSGVVQYGAEAEILWIKLKLGTFMPHMPTKKLLDIETPLPEASGKNFWLKGSAWQFPTHENVDTFIEQLAREEILVRDPVVDATLKGHLKPEALSPRTLRHRFQHSTGLTQGHIFQYERAQRAVALLEQGYSILDTVYEAGYFDQPHLTRSLKTFIGYTPAQLLRKNE
jgi:AraC-like DNA-binding protein